MRFNIRHQKKQHKQRITSRIYAVLIKNTYNILRNIEHTLVKYTAVLSQNVSNMFKETSNVVQIEYIYALLMKLRICSTKYRIYSCTIHDHVVFNRGKRFLTIEKGSAPKVEQPFLQN